MSAHLKEREREKEGEKTVMVGKGNLVSHYYPIDIYHYPY